jgi:hypothetical protein
LAKKKCQIKCSVRFTVSPRVARSYTFKPKIPIWVNTGGFCDGRCWYILWPHGLFHVHLVYYVAIRSILRPFGIFFNRFGTLRQEKSGNPGFPGPEKIDFCFPQLPLSVLNVTLNQSVKSFYVVISPNRVHVGT